MDDNWMKDLRNRMENHAEAAPKDLWEDIEQHMMNIDIDTQLQPKKIGNRKRIITIVSIAASLLLLSFIGIQIASTDSAIKDSEVMVALAVRHTKQNIGSGIFAINNSSSTQIDKSEGSSSFNQEKILSNNPTNIAIDHNVADTTLFEEQQTEPLKEVLDVSKTSNEADDTHKSDKPKQYDVLPSNSDNYNNLLAALGKQKRRQSNNDDRGWNTALFASNTPTRSSNSYEGYGRMNRGSVLYVSDDGNYPQQNTSLANILLYNNEKVTYTDIKHSQPITTGISFNYRINARWSVGSGITYSYLSSKLKSGADGYYYDTKQYLHFLGIPFTANYTIWENRRILFYGSAGGQGQRLISGKMNTDYINDNKVNKSERESVSEHRLYWSVNAAVGIQYKVTEQLGLYFEPNVNYYFNNGSSLETIYKEHPLNFGLKLGFRISFQ